MKKNCPQAKLKYDKLINLQKELNQVFSDSLKTKNFSRPIEIKKEIEETIKEIEELLPMSEKKIKNLTKEIKEKTENNQELNEEELKFIYGLDKQIKNKEYLKEFEYVDYRGSDKWIKQNRPNPKKDLSELLQVPEDQITTTKEELLEGNSKYHLGNLDLRNHKTAKDLILPTTINGYLDLESLETAKDLILPTTINGSLYLDSLKTAKDLIFPTTINGDLYLKSLKSAEDLILPTTINGDLDLDSLETAEDLILPTTINGSLDLRSLKTVEDLNLTNTKVKDKIYLKALPDNETEELKIKYPDLRFEKRN